MLKLKRGMVPSSVFDSAFGVHVYMYYYFFGSLPKIKKLWHFEIFLNTGPYAAGNFKVLFLPQFSLEPIQTL